MIKGYQGGIAIIGSCHLDVIANYSPSLPMPVDVQGTRISYSVGGVAYNIAQHMTRYGIKVNFLTVTKQNSLLDFIIKSAFTKHRISTKFLVYDEHNDISGGYVAIIQEGKTIQAVSTTPFDNGSFSLIDICNLIEGTNAVVIDTNLRPEQISLVCMLAKERGLPIFCSIASETKVLRLKTALEKCSTHVLSFLAMNHREAVVFFGDAFFELSSEEMLSLAKTNLLVVTLGKDGVVFYNKHGIQKFSAFKIDVKNENTLGTGDAFFAGVCCELLKDKNSSPCQLFNATEQFITNAIKSTSASEEVHFSF